MFDSASLKRKQSLLISALTLTLLLPFNNCSSSNFEAFTPPGETTSSDQPSSSQNETGTNTPPPPTVVEPTPEPPTVEEPVSPPVTISPTTPTTPTLPPTPEPPPPTTGAGAAFLATGHMRTSMYTCDGGRTWRGYRTANANLRCWDSSSGNFDCDHDSTSNVGLTYGTQGFLATYGWGRPGHVEMSRDGNTWTQVQSGNTWAGVAFGNETYILNERSPLVSRNGGQSWQRGGDINFTPWNARRIFFFNIMGGVFLSTAQSGDVHDLMYSPDNGANFMRPIALPANCGNGHMAASNTRIVLLSRQVCTSDDGGRTWIARGNAIDASSLIFNGNEFLAYSGRTVRRSSDGVTWTNANVQIQPATNAFVALANVAYHPATRQYVAISQDWGRYYEQTQYLHSSDGISWTLVDKTRGSVPNSSHPIRTIVPGYLDVCR